MGGVIDLELLDRLKRINIGKEPLFPEAGEWLSENVEPWLKRLADLVGVKGTDSGEPIDLTMFMPVEAVYYKTRGVWPKLIDMFHGRNRRGAEQVAKLGIQTENDRKAMWRDELNKLRKAIFGNTGEGYMPLPSDEDLARFDELWKKVHHEPRNMPKQPDAVYLASEPGIAGEYGDYVFHVRADANKFRPDDDFMHSWAQTQARRQLKEDGLTPLSMDYLNRFDKIRRQLFNDFLQNPDDFRHLAEDSIRKQGQVASVGSIPPYRIRNVGLAYPELMKDRGANMDEVQEFLKKLEDIIAQDRPKLRR
jgi:hypothetical protein